MDPIREKIDGTSLVDTPHRHKLHLPETSVDLLNQIQCSVQQIRLILSCIFDDTCLNHPLYSYCYGLVAMDISILFRFLNLALVAALQNFFSLPRDCAERTLFAYKEYTQLQLAEEVHTFVNLGPNAVSIKDLDIPGPLRQDELAVKQLTKSLEDFLYSPKSTDGTGSGNNNNNTGNEANSSDSSGTAIANPPGRKIHNSHRKHSTATPDSSISKSGSSSTISSTTSATTNNTTHSSLHSIPHNNSSNNASASHSISHNKLLSNMNGSSTSIHHTGRHPTGFTSPSTSSNSSNDSNMSGFSSGQTSTTTATSVTSTTSTTTPSGITSLSALSAPPLSSLTASAVGNPYSNMSVTSLAVSTDGSDTLPDPTLSLTSVQRYNSLHSNSSSSQFPPSPSSNLPSPSYHQFSSPLSSPVSSTFEIPQKSRLRNSRSITSIVASNSNSVPNGNTSTRTPHNLATSGSIRSATSSNYASSIQNSIISSNNPYHSNNTHSHQYPSDTTIATSPVDESFEGNTVVYDLQCTTAPGGSPPSQTSTASTGVSGLSQNPYSNAHNLTFTGSETTLRQQSIASSSIYETSNSPYSASTPNLSQMPNNHNSPGGNNQFVVPSNPAVPALSSALLSTTGAIPETLPLGSSSAPSSSEVTRRNSKNYMARNSLNSSGPPPSAPPTSALPVPPQIASARLSKSSENFKSTHFSSRDSYVAPLNLENQTTKITSGNNNNNNNTQIFKHSESSSTSSSVTLRPPPLKSSSSQSQSSSSSSSSVENGSAVVTNTRRSPVSSPISSSVYNNGPTSNASLHIKRETGLPSPPLRSDESHSWQLAALPPITKSTTNNSNVSKTSHKTTATTTNSQSNITDPDTLPQGFDPDDTSLENWQKLFDSLDNSEATFSLKFDLAAALRKTIDHHDKRTSQALTAAAAASSASSLLDIGGGSSSPVPPLPTLSPEESKKYFSHQGSDSNSIIGRSKSSKTVKSTHTTGSLRHDNSLRSNGTMGTHSSSSLIATSTSGTTTTTETNPYHGTESNSYFKTQGQHLSGTVLGKVSGSSSGSGSGGSNKSHNLTVDTVAANQSGGYMTNTTPALETFEENSDSHSHHHHIHGYGHNKQSGSGRGAGGGGGDGLVLSPNVAYTPDHYPASPTTAGVGGGNAGGMFFEKSLKKKASGFLKTFRSKNTF